MEKETLKWGNLSISKGTPSSVLITDNVDCDMTFTFELVEDTDRNRSFTKYHVISESEAVIIISNPQKEPLHPERMIEVGTYQKRYRLFVDFVLAAQDDEKDIYNQRRLDYYFYISPIEER